MNLGDKMYTTTHFVILEQFANTYFQFKLTLEEIRQSTQNAFIYIENLRTELDMLSLSHLSPSNISPKNFRTLILDFKDKLPKYYFFLQYLYWITRKFTKFIKFIICPYPKKSKVGFKSKNLNVIAKYDISTDKKH